MKLTPVCYSWNDIPFSIKLQFFSLWHAISIVGDMFILLASLASLYSESKTQFSHVDTISRLLLGLGCLILCSNLTKYLEYDYTFYTLILTLRHSFWKVCKFTFSCAPIFFGYAFCGVSLFSPYSDSFVDLDSTTVTLFALLNGDDIHATFSDLAKRYPLLLFSRIYLYTFVLLFITAVLNVFIFIIEDGYHLAKVLSSVNIKQLSNNTVDNDSLLLWKVLSRTLDMKKLFDIIEAEYPETKPGKSTLLESEESDDLKPKKHDNHDDNDEDRRSSHQPDIPSDVVLPSFQPNWKFSTDDDKDEDKDEEFGKNQAKYTPDSSPSPPIKKPPSIPPLPISTTTTTTTTATTTTTTPPTSKQSILRTTFLDLRKHPDISPWKSQDGKGGDVDSDDEDQAEKSAITANAKKRSSSRRTKLEPVRQHKSLAPLVMVDDSESTSHGEGEDKGQALGKSQDQGQVQAQGQGQGQGPDQVQFLDRAESRRRRLGTLGASDRRTGERPLARTTGSVRQLTSSPSSKLALMLAERQKQYMEEIQKQLEASQVQFMAQLSLDIAEMIKLNPTNTGTEEGVGLGFRTPRTPVPPRLTVTTPTPTTTTTITTPTKFEMYRDENESQPTVEVSEQVVTKPTKMNETEPDQDDLSGAPVVGNDDGCDEA
eukprot:TRINITY_DN12699_c0_g1_i6.p1 TRINITY_DN12699_c0_g1~~TRINITY_DN12699_c0_g1_i6.p1  ORF type:complete len:723 (-),score=193.66 TRINITY_DN12699_c0_g1_i6:206-2167(-)